MKRYIINETELAFYNIIHDAAIKKIREDRDHYFLFCQCTDQRDKGVEILGKYIEDIIDNKMKIIEALS